MRAVSHSYVVAGKFALGAEQRFAISNYPVSEAPISAVRAPLVVAPVGGRQLRFVSIRLSRDHLFTFTTGDRVS